MRNALNGMRPPKPDDRPASYRESMSGLDASNAHGTGFGDTGCDGRAPHSNATPSYSSATPPCSEEPCPAHGGVRYMPFANHGFMHPTPPGSTPYAQPGGAAFSHRQPGAGPASPFVPPWGEKPSTGKPRRPSSAPSQRSSILRSSQTIANLGLLGFGPRDEPS